MNSRGSSVITRGLTVAMKLGPLNGGISFCLPSAPISAGGGGLAKGSS